MKKWILTFYGFLANYSCLQTQKQSPEDFASYYLSEIWLISQFEQEYDKLLESIELMSFTPLYNIVLFKDAYYCMIYFYTFLSEFSNLAPCLKVSLLRSLFLCRKINLTKLTSGFGVIINFSLLCVCSYQFLPLFSSIYTKNSCRFLSCWRMGTKK